MLSSPVIGADGTIYIGSQDGNLYALYPNGKKKWSFNSGDIVGYTPTIDSNGISYIGSSKNLYALYPNGTEKWNYTTENYITSSPAIGSDGTIYFGNNYKLCALNPDGTLKWNFTTKGIILFSPPTVGSDGTIYVGSEDGHLYALYPNGTEKWNFTGNGYIFASPAIGCDGTSYIASGNKLYSITSTGNLKWEYSITNDTDPRLFSSPAIGSNGVIYVGSDNGYLYAFNTDGTLKWKYQTGDEIDSSPCIGSDGTVYVGSADKFVYAINPDGTLKWKYQTGYGIGSSPCIGSDGTLYIGSQDNNLYAFHDLIIPPTASSNLKSGSYNTTKTVKLTMNGTGTIYYTLNGTTPTTRSNVYTGPITIKSTTVLKYFAVDLAGNSSQVYTMSYTIDKTAPKITKTTPANNAQGVALTTPITIKFSEKITKGTNFNNIYIKNMTTGKITHTTVTISGNTITIKMLKNRLNKNKYEVYIPTGAFKDLAGNKNNAYLLNFKTR
ncbi:MAG: PQQ-binding-like beta-propeller repeat protein [Methanobacterium sp. ERen5]|nr:MAG: PQQ-binding-like beta-propeller repeat protein [Methanobacterium sp. ERen5]